MQASYWDPATLQARVADPKRRQRFAGGSPDPTEIAAYRRGLPTTGLDLAIVLGMTPELRNLAAGCARQVLSIDASTHAIAMYRDWLAPPLRNRERIVQGDWREHLPGLAGEADAVFGDGVFANLPTPEAQLDLLRAIHGALRPQGRLITRKILIPDGFSIEAHSAEVLVQRYRNGSIDALEFGFGMRITGGIRSLYDPRAYVLENADLFRRYRRQRDAGRLTDEEYGHIMRFYFGGNNCILTQRTWEAFLTTAGYAVQRPCYKGKLWYGYYPVYCARKVKETGQDAGHSSAAPSP